MTKVRVTISMDIEIDQHPADVLHAIHSGDLDLYYLLDTYNDLKITTEAVPEDQEDQT